MTRMWWWLELMATVHLIYITTSSAYPVDKEMRQKLPFLRGISLSEVASLPAVPTTKIRTDDDLEHWKSMQSYRDYIIYLRRLNDSVVGTSLPWIPKRHSQVWFCVNLFFCWFVYLSRKKKQKQKSVDRLLVLLDTLEQWIIEIRPLQSPQRFGNLAFRTWGQRLEEVGIYRFSLRHMHININRVVEVRRHTWDAVGAWICCGDTLCKTLPLVFVRVFHSDGLWNWSRNLFRFISVMFDTCPIFATWAWRRPRHRSVCVPSLF